MKLLAVTQSAVRVIGTRVPNRALPSHLDGQLTAHTYSALADNFGESSHLHTMAQYTKTGTER